MMLFEDVLHRWRQWRDLCPPLTVGYVRELLGEAYGAEEIPLAWHALDNPADDEDLHVERLAAAFTLTNPDVLSQYVFADASQPCEGEEEEHWPHEFQYLLASLRDGGQWPWNFMEIQHQRKARASVVLEAHEGVVTGWKVYPYGTALDAFFTGLIGFPRIPGSAHEEGHMDEGNLDDPLFLEHVRQAEACGFLGNRRSVALPNLSAWIPMLTSPAEKDSEAVSPGSEISLPDWFGEEGGPPQVGTGARSEGDAAELLPEWLSIEQVHEAWLKRGATRFGLPEARALLLREFHAAPAPHSWVSLACTHLDFPISCAGKAESCEVLVISEPAMLERLGRTGWHASGGEGASPQAQGTSTEFLAQPRTEDAIVGELCASGSAVLVFLESSDGGELSGHCALGVYASRVSSFMDGLFGFPETDAAEISRGWPTMRIGDLSDPMFRRHLVCAYLEGALPV